MTFSNSIPEAVISFFFFPASSSLCNKGDQFVGRPFFLKRACLWERGLSFKEHIKVSSKNTQHDAVRCHRQPALLPAQGPGAVIQVPGCHVHSDKSGLQVRSA